MGFRRSTAYKVLPGVRLTLREPGTGVQRPLALRSVVPLAPERSPRPPGRRCPPWEHRLHRSLLLGDPDRVHEVATRHGHAVLGATLAGLTAYAADAGSARPLLRDAWQAGCPVERHPFLLDHLAHATVRIDLTEDVQAAVPISRDAVGLALVAVERDLGDLDAAVEVAEDLDPSVVATLALAELYRRTDRPHDLVELTEGMTNTDDALALLLVQRAAALRACGREQQAGSVLADAIRRGVRGSAVRRLAQREQARMRREE